MTLAAISRRIRSLTRRSLGSAFRALRYEASCHDLLLAVHGQASSWNVRVRDTEGNTLYVTARRTLEDARRVAVEFLVLRMTGALEPATVSVVAQHVPWRRR